MRRRTRKPPATLTAVVLTGTLPPVGIGQTFGARDRLGGHHLVQARRRRSRLRSPRSASAGAGSTLPSGRMPAVLAILATDSKTTLWKREFHFRKDDEPCTLTGRP